MLSPFGAGVKAGKKSPFGNYRPIGLGYRVLGDVPGLVADFVRNRYLKTDVSGNKLEKTKIPEMLVFERDSLATMTDVDGMIKWNPHNELPGSTNIAIGDIWNEGGFGGDGGIIEQGYSAPDGSNTAVRLARGENLDFHITNIRSEGAVGPEEPNRTRVVYARTVSGTGTATLGVRHNTTNSTQTITEEWQRFEIDTKNNDSGYDNFYLVDLRNASLDEIILWAPHQYRSDLGGMVNVPTDMRVGGSETYVPTYDESVFLPRVGHHEYVPFSEDEIVNSTSFGPELIENGDFSNGSEGWSVFGGGEIVFQNNRAEVVTNTGATVNLSGPKLIPGKWYALSAEYFDPTSSIFLRGDSSFSQERLDNLFPSGGRYIFKAGGSYENLIIHCQSVDELSFIDNISLREVTAGSYVNRGALVEPYSANRFPTSADPGTYGVTSASYGDWVDSPIGPKTARLVNLEGGVTFHRIFSASGFPDIRANEDCTFSVFVRPLKPEIALQLLMYDGDDTTNSFEAEFVFDSEAINDNKGKGTGILKDAYMERWGNGWWRLILSGNANGGNADVRTFPQMRPKRTGIPTVAGTYFEIGGVQLERGLVATSYMPTYDEMSTRSRDDLILPDENIPFEEGPELIKNPNFENNGEGWSDGSDISFGNNGAVLTHDGGGNVISVAKADLAPNRSYILRYKVDGSNGQWNIEFADGTNLVTNEGGIEEGEVKISPVAGEGHSIRIKCRDGSVAFKEISVKEISMPKPVFYEGQELVTNGNFETDLSGWVDTGSDWYWDNGAAYDGDDNSSVLRQSVPTVPGRTYNFSATAYNVTGGNPSILIDNSTVATFSSELDEETKTFTFKAADDFTDLEFSGVNATWRLDNVSVKEIPELVKNGQFENGISDWEDDGNATLSWNSNLNGIVIQRTGTVLSGRTTARQIVEGFKIGKTYRVYAEVHGLSKEASIDLYPDDFEDSPHLSDTRINEPGVLEEYFVAEQTSYALGLGARTDLNASATFKNVSIKEVEKVPAVCFAIKGRMRYADKDSYNTVRFVRWIADGDTIYLSLNTFGSENGTVKFAQNAGSAERSTNADVYEPGLSVPFSIASRHAANSIHGASDGELHDTYHNPFAMPYLADTNIYLASEGVLTIEDFRMWAKDITKEGIVEASK